MLEAVCVCYFAYRGLCNCWRQCVCVTLPIEDCATVGGSVCVLLCL